MTPPFPEPPEDSYADLREKCLRPKTDFDPARLKHNKQDDPDYYSADAIRGRHGWPKHVHVLPEAHRLADEIANLKGG